MKKNYKSVFANLLKLMVRDKEIKEQLYPIYEESVGTLFHLGGRKLEEYASLVRSNEIRATHDIEEIAVNIIQEKKLSKFSFYSIDECDKRIKPEEEAKNRPFQLVLNEGAKKVGVVFSMYSDCKNHFRKFYNGEYKVDALLLVIIALPNDEGYSSFFRALNGFNIEADVKINRITIDQFWRDYFGEDELVDLLEAIDEFNNEAQKIVGFSTVVTPTKNAINKFRKTIGDELQNYRYLEKVPLNINSSQVNIIANNFLKRGLWRAMIGKSNFALSFVTSEWYYKMYILTENLDLTNIIAGYLKSVEQLLFEIIKLYKDKGITIQTNDGIKKYSEVPEDIVKTTLYALENVIIKNNTNDILDINSDGKKYLVDVIDDWRDKYRNKYFHKENLQSKEKLEEIRELVYYVYFLVLGSCKINDNQFEQLGIEE